MYSNQMTNNAEAHGVGVCYGRLGNNLPSPSETVSLYKKNNIKKMRIFDPHPPTLHALSGSGIYLMLGIPDQDLQTLAECQENANKWVKGNITCYPDVKFRYIVVGNEIDPQSPTAKFVLKAMQNIYHAVCEAGYGNVIRVSTSVKTDLIQNSFPPSHATFKSNVIPYIKPILEFLISTRAPLLVNVYPYFAYIEDKGKKINLSFALLQPNSGVYADGFYYDNLFYAILDAVDVAMEKLTGKAPGVDKAGDSPKPGVLGSETGWKAMDATKRKPPPPIKTKKSGGDDEESDSVGTVENARIYNNNLMRIVKNGTPRNPDRRPIETYIFAMYDENEKPEDERYFGIFYANGTRKYPLRFY